MNDSFEFSRTLLKMNCRNSLCMDDLPSAKRQRVEDTAKIKDPTDVMVNLVAAKARAAIAKLKPLTDEVRSGKSETLPYTIRAFGGMVKPVSFDRLGNPLDKDGNIISAAKPSAHSNLKVNQKSKREHDISRTKASTKQAKHIQSSDRNPWYDTQLQTGFRSRKAAFRFVQQGFYTATEARMNDAGNEAAESDPLQKHLATPVRLRTEALIPEIEPWDSVIVRTSPDDSDLGFSWELATDKITHYVEHPVPIAPHGVLAGATPVYLTLKERRKLRRRKRMEREKEKQDRIRLGMLPPPPPKIKLANLMRVLGEEAAAEPSKTEQEVRQQMADRVIGHHRRNQARMLTTDQRRTKNINHWKQSELTKTMVHVAVYSVHKDLDDLKLFFKIAKNADQLHLTGVAVYFKGRGNLVVVEGGPRAVRRYKRLMLRRIQWSPSQTIVPESDDEVYGGSVADKGGDAALLELQYQAKDPHFPRVLWEGVVEEKSFGRWQAHIVSSEVEIRKALPTEKTYAYWEKLHQLRDVTEDIDE
ncbi:MAG: uncharacterized protein KVP18_001009 [Porospora cf. gigantea A]|uniref:uncharacterized protein n=1 Tax=Porospora cf. gigantea A TaxID=2853593 RepID=UPI00355949BD|nr:MAG: hypothetical protein KVP18_001009 [Porospora cf. gigantea A]